MKLARNAIIINYEEQHVYGRKDDKMHACGTKLQNRTRQKRKKEIHLSDKIDATPVEHAKTAKQLYNESWWLGSRNMKCDISVCSSRVTRLQKRVHFVQMCFPLFSIVAYRFTFLEPCFCSVGGLKLENKQSDLKILFGIKP